MSWPACLTQAQFAKGARAWTDRASLTTQTEGQLGSDQAAKGWEWKEHQVRGRSCAGGGMGCGDRGFEG